MARVAAGSAAEAARGVSRRGSFGVAAALLSFALYGCLVLSLPQVRDARHCCEQSSFAAAVSNIVYRAPLGSMYSGVFDFFIVHFEEPLKQTLRLVRAPGAGLPATPPGIWVPTTLDGNGVGYPLVATVAFRLFGWHALAPPLTMLILMAVSAAAFLRRFYRAHAGVVVLYFSALTAMLFTPLVWDPAYAVQIAVGGIRYFSLVSVLPVFHILLSLRDRPPARPGTRWRDGVPLALQTVILVLAILVRGSTLPLIGAVAVVGLALAWQRRRDAAQLRPLLRKFAVIAVTALAFLTAIVLAVPREYIANGRFGTVIWQRVVQSIGLSPAWPFPGVNDMFDCKTFSPTGFEGGPVDNNGMCIWLDYVARHNIPLDSLADKTYGGQFEIAMREAFFKIADRYPGEVAKAFIYYKPGYVASSLTESMKFNFNGDRTRAVVPTGRPVIPYSPVAIGLLAASLCLAVAYFGIATVSLIDVRQVAAATLIAVLFTLPSYIAVWALPHTTADLLLYCFFSMGLACGAIVLGLRAAMRRGTGPTG